MSDELRWHTHTDDSTGKTYYHDVLDNKTQWEKPENLDEPLAGYSVLLYEKRWHSRCLVCSADGCDASLWGQGKTAHLADNGHLYCKEHFSSLFSLTCALCNEACLGAIVKAFGNAWHPRCFKCSDPECGKLYTETDAVGGFGKPY